MDCDDAHKLCDHRCTCVIENGIVHSRFVLPSYLQIWSILKMTVVHKRDSTPKRLLSDRIMGKEKLGRHATAAAAATAAKPLKNGAKSTEFSHDHGTRGAGSKPVTSSSTLPADAASSQLHRHSAASDQDVKRTRVDDYQKENEVRAEALVEKTPTEFQTSMPSQKIDSL